MDAVGASWAALAAGEGSQERGIGTLLVEVGLKGKGRRGVKGENDGGKVKQRKEMGDHGKRRKTIGNSAGARAGVKGGCAIEKGDDE